MVGGMKTRRGRNRDSSSPSRHQSHGGRHGGGRSGGGGGGQFGRRRQFKDIELPPTFEVDVFALNEEGEPVAVPVERRDSGFATRWVVTHGAAVAVGQRALARVAGIHHGEVTLNAIRVVEKPQARAMVALLGPFGMVRVMHRELANVDFVLRAEDQAKAKEGDYLRVLPGLRPMRGATPVQLVENLGPSPKGLESLTAIENAGIPVAFPDDALEECEALPAYRFDAAEGRADWRGLPIVTIDGADARDFDDAVWAEQMENGGHRIIVAIADVAHYLKEGGALDHAARERGNSTYFADRVVPMLPEKLSNDLCSLRPAEDRPVLGVEMEIDAEGRLRGHRFYRAVIHSHARLTYVQVQNSLDGKPDGAPEGLLPALRNLEAAYKVLWQARKRRGALDLEIPEIGVLVDKEGEVSGVAVRERLTSHKLIEEMMILANVAAAEVLSKKGVPGFYRVHDRPDKMKLMTLNAALGPLGFTVPGPDGGHKAWAHLVEQVQKHPAAQTLLRQILQSQMQARYDLENIGHYGLALPLYAHFTSPIRRYSDVVVHRALIKALKLPGKGALESDVHKLGHVGEHINVTERRSQQAEWEARDRLMTRYFAKHIGKEYPGVVTSAQSFGLFVSIPEGAEGLLPARLLGWDWQYEARDLCWHNRRAKKTLRAGSALAVKLIDADRVLGRLTFGPASGTAHPPEQTPTPRRPEDGGGRSRRPRRR